MGLELLKILQFMHHRNFVASAETNPQFIHLMLHEYLKYQEKTGGFCQCSMNVSHESKSAHFMQQLWHESIEKKND